MKSRCLTLGKLSCRSQSTAKQHTTAMFPLFVTYSIGQSGRCRSRQLAAKATLIRVQATFNENLLVKFCQRQSETALFGGNVKRGMPIKFLHLNFFFFVRVNIPKTGCFCKLCIRSV